MPGQPADLDSTHALAHADGRMYTEVLGKIGRWGPAGWGVGGTVYDRRGKYHHHSDNGMAATGDWDAILNTEVSSKNSMITASPSCFVYGGL